MKRAKPIMAYFGGFGCCFDVIVFLSCGKEKGRLKRQPKYKDLSDNQNSIAAAEGK